MHAAFESMNPLEAVEHQGGLQLDSPPYELIVDQKCYWRNQPIACESTPNGRVSRIPGIFNRENCKTLLISAQSPIPHQKACSFNFLLTHRKHVYLVTTGARLTTVDFSDFTRKK